MQSKVALPSKKLQQRPMILLEVMIAIALVALCILPIIYPQIAIVQEQRSMMRHMELDHAIHLLYVDILDQLYFNKIEWGAIEGKRLMPIAEAILPKGYSGSYSFEILKEKNDLTQQKEKSWMAYQVQLTFTIAKTNQKENVSQPAFIFPYKITILRHLGSNDSKRSPPDQKGESIEE